MVLFIKTQQLHINSINMIQRKSITFHIYFLSLKMNSLITIIDTSKLDKSTSMSHK